MSVQTQIDRISRAVSDALAALTDKGVTVPAGTKVDGLAELIAAIEAGGGGGDITAVATGTLTYSEDTDSNFTFVLNHNLGIIPSALYITDDYSKAALGLHGYLVIRYVDENENVRYRYVYTRYQSTTSRFYAMRSDINESHSMTKFFMDDETFTATYLSMDGSNTPAFFKAGVTYTYTFFR